MHHQMKRMMRRIAVLGIASAMCVSSALASTATVNTSLLRLRSDATTASAILASAPMGSTVDILETAANGWYKVSYQNIQGYMFGQYLMVSDATVQTAQEVTYASASPETAYGQVNTVGSTLNLRSGAGTDYSCLTSIPNGTVLTLGDSLDGWYSVTYNGVSGYVLGSYLTLMDEATASAAISAQATVSTGDQIVALAQNYLGYPYVYGAAGPSSFDCSGFTRYIYSQFGYSLAHGATAQLSYGYYVDSSDLQPGDLVFFRHGVSTGASHVGIYIGNGEFIHASTASTGVRIDSLYSSYYSSCFIGGRHVVS